MPSEVRDQMQFHIVGSVDQVLALALEPSGGRDGCIGFPCSHHHAADVHDIRFRLAKRSTIDELSPSIVASASVDSVSCGGAWAAGVLAGTQRT